jgi:bacteriorhodopsin
MENKTPNDPIPDTGEVDPEADLALLERARSSLELDQALDPGPWWYGPLAAAAIATATLAAHQGATAVLGVAIVVCLLLALHDRQRRPVRPRPSARSATLVVPFVLGAFFLMALWGTAVEAIGYEDFVPWWALVGWLITTALLLGVRAILAVLRERRTPIQ